jgi:hypothetical protein
MTGLSKEQVFCESGFFGVFRGILGEITAINCKWFKHRLNRNFNHARFKKFNSVEESLNLKCELAEFRFSLFL